MLKKLILFLLLVSIPIVPAFATLSSTTNRMDYVGNGAVDTYSYSFKIFSNTDLLVTVRNTSDVETTLSLGTDYTVTGVGNLSGGTIALVNSGQAWLDGDGDLKTDYALTIRRVLPIKQNTDIRNQGAFYPEVHEDEFDILTMIHQQQQDEINRSMKLPETIDSSTFDPSLPASLVGNAGASFIVNATGDGFTSGPSASDIASAQSNATAAAASAAEAAASVTDAVNASASSTYLWGGTVGGTGNAITLTPSPALSSYGTGKRIAFLATASNTTAATVNVSGLGVKNIKTQSGAALTSGEITSGRVYSMTYDGTNFIVHELANVEDGAITNAKVNSSAAIAYSKLNLSASVTRTDIATGYGLVPSGAIIMWSGTIATIPTGWELSDGSCAITCPDLRDRFVVGATSDDSGLAKSNVSGSLTQTGGSSTKNIQHTHTYSGTTDGAPSQGSNYDGSSSPVSTPGHTHTYSGTTANGGSTTQDVLNPYYALAFIIKD